MKKNKNPDNITPNDQGVSEITPIGNEEKSVVPKKKRASKKDKQEVIEQKVVEQQENQLEVSEKTVTNKIDDFFDKKFNNELTEAEQEEIKAYQDKFKEFLEDKFKNNSGELTESQIASALKEYQQDINRVSRDKNLMTTRRVLKEIEDINFKLIYAEPFYAYFFSGLARKVSKVGTACVSRYKNNAMLQVDPEFWDTLKDPQKIGLIKHEILHLLFKHILLHNKITNPNFKVLNIACDIVVNQYISEEQMPTDTAVRLQNFTKKDNPQYIDLESNQSAEYYYYKLMDLYNKFQPQLQKEMQDAIKNAVEKQKNKQTGSPSKGEGEGEGQGEGQGDNEGDGNGTPSNNPSNNDSNIKNQDGYKSWKELEKFVLQDEFSHAFWKTFDEMSDVERQILDSTINDNTLKAHGKAAGNTPSHINTLIQDILDSKASVVDWRALLKRHIKNAFNSRLKNTIHRVSKRYGTSPGIKKEFKQTVMVILDTSGSISDQDIADFFVEINKIYKEGHKIHVVESDCAIAKTWDYKGDLPEVVTGRGGTDFDPGLEYANEYRKQSVVVYFTDGYASSPRVDCKSKIIWCISRGGINQPLQNCPGNFVYLDNVKQ